MLKLNTRNHGHASVLKLATAAMAAALACGSVCAQTSRAQNGAPLAVQLASVKLADLEHAFWTCEYAATMRGNANIKNCTAIYEALKTRKFEGDFDSLLQWWQQNREAMYRRLAASDVSFAGER